MVDKIYARTNEGPFQSNYHNSFLVSNGFQLPSVLGCTTALIMSATVDGFATRMFAAPCFRLPASGPAGLACGYTRVRTSCLQPRRKAVHQHHCRANGAVYEPTLSCETLSDQASSFKLVLEEAIVNSLHAHAVCFRCWNVDLQSRLAKFYSERHAGLGEWGLPESLVKKHTPQEQAELLSVAFITDVTNEVFKLSGILSPQRCIQDSVHDLLSLAIVASALQQVLQEVMQVC